MRTKTFARGATCTLVAVAMLAAATPSDAFFMLQNTSTGRVTAGNLVTCDDPGGFTHWTTANISWRHNTANQGSGKQTALQNAMNSWTNVTGAEHVLTYAGTTGAGWSTDGVNTVLWAVGNGCTFGCLALTALVLQSGQVIVESDVTFNNNQTWTTNGSNYDTETVAAHEFGHTLGIHHSEVNGATMKTPYFGSGGRSLEADDRAALQCSQSKYPVCPPGGGVPATPASLSVYNHICWGNNDMDWAFSCGATYYELYGSLSSNFTSQWLEYSGPDLHDWVVVSTTTYYRVRACNAAGCSGYRVGNQPARYYPYCL